MATRLRLEPDENSSDMFVVVGTRTVPNVVVAGLPGKIVSTEGDDLSATALPNASMPENLVFSSTALPVSNQDNLESNTLQNAAVPMNLSSSVLQSTSVSVNDNEKRISSTLGDTTLPQNLSDILPESSIRENLVHADFSNAAMLAGNQDVHPSTSMSTVEDNSTATHQDTSMPQNLSSNGIHNTALTMECHENLSITVLPNTAMSPKSPENLSVTVLPSTAMPEAVNLSCAVLQNPACDPGNGSSKTLPAFSVMAGLSSPQDHSNNSMISNMQHITVTQNLSSNGMPAAASHVNIGFGHVLVKGELPSPSSTSDPPPATIRLFVPENNVLSVPPGQLTFSHALVKGEHNSPSDPSCTCHVSVPMSVHDVHEANTHAHVGNELSVNTGEINMGHILIKGEYTNAEQPQYGDEENPQYSSTVDPQYPSAVDQQYTSTENQQYLSAGNMQYSSAEEPHYHSREDQQQYSSTEDSQYPSSQGPQYASVEDVQYPATAEAQYSASEPPGSISLQVCAENLSNSCLSTPTLVQILRDPSTALRGPNPSAAALLISNISRMPVPENLSSSAEHSSTTHLPVTDSYSYSTVQISVPENLTSPVAISGAESLLPRPEMLPKICRSFATGQPARSEMVTRLPRLSLRAELMSSDGLPTRKTSAVQKLPSPAQQLPSPVALCLSMKGCSADNPLVAVVKREVEYSDHTDYNYQSQQSSRMSQFSPVSKQKAVGEQTVRLPSIDTVVDRRVRMETASRDTLVVDRRVTAVHDTATSRMNDTDTPSSGLSEDVLSEFAIEFLAQRALQQSAQQAALQQAARQAVQQAVRDSTASQLQVPCSSSLVAMTLASPLLAVPSEPAVKKRRRSHASVSDNEPLNLGSKKRQRTALSLEVEPSQSPMPGPRKQRSFTHTGGRTCVCEVCNAVLSAPASLKTHMLIHSNIKPYPCNQCDAAFRHQSTLKRHMCIHTGEKNFSCSVCQAQFARKTELTQHQRSHSTARPYSCKICASSYKHPKDLSQHLRNHARNAPHVCKECNASFNDIAALKDHTRSHEGAGKLPTCDVCGAKFDKVLSLTQHVVSSHMPSTPVKHEKDESKASCSSCRLTCTLCSLQFDDNTLMTQHMKESHWAEHVKSLGETKKGESGQQQHICKMCGKHFNTNNALSQHIKKKHWFADVETKNPAQSADGDEETDDEYKYGCSLCGMEYPRLKSLAQHMKKSHSVNMLPCNKCGNTFVHMHNWLDHLKNCDA